MLNRWRSSLTGATALLLLAGATSAQALEVEISPKNPQLGDTISVMVDSDTVDTKPLVTVGGKNYPVYEVGEAYRTLIPTSPLDRAGKMTVRVQGDDTTRNLGIWLKNRSFPIQRIWLSGKASRPATQSELDKVRAFKKLKTPTKFWQGSFARPHAARVSSVFGIRRYYNGVFANNYYHKGVDYAGSMGSTVVAPAAGRISLIGKESEDFHVHGNTIGIDHGQGVVSIMMHLQDIYVREGDMVKPGQKIGSVGTTGASTGAHLHWGLYVNEIAVDPVPWRFSRID